MPVFTAICGSNEYAPEVRQLRITWLETGQFSIRRCAAAYLPQDPVLPLETVFMTGMWVPTLCCHLQGKDVSSSSHAGRFSSALFGTVVPCLQRHECSLTCPVAIVLCGCGTRSQVRFLFLLWRGKTNAADYFNHGPMARGIEEYVVRTVVLVSRAHRPPLSGPFQDPCWFQFSYECKRFSFFVFTAFLQHQRRSYFAAARFTPF